MCVVSRACDGTWNGTPRALEGMNPGLPWDWESRDRPLVRDGCDWQSQPRTRAPRPRGQCWLMVSVAVIGVPFSCAVTVTVPENVSLVYVAV